MNEKPIIHMLLDTNGFDPPVVGKMNKKKELTSDSSILLESFSYSRCGVFLKGLNIPYEYFLVNNVFRLGFVIAALGAPFNMQAAKNLKNRHLTVLWTDSLSIVDYAMPNQLEPFILAESKKGALSTFNRIVEMLIWLRSQKGYLLKNSRCKEITPLFSEYVLNAQVQLCTLQSAFLEHAKKQVKPIQK